MTEIIIDAYRAPDVYLVNPRKPDLKRVASHLTIATFDLSMSDFRLVCGRIELEQWARGINVRLWSYLGDPYHNNDSVNIFGWMIDSSEKFDVFLFEAIDTLCQRYGLSFAGMIESLGFLLQ